jgi:hypothetical protein
MRESVLKYTSSNRISDPREQQAGFLILKDLKLDAAKRTRHTGHPVYYILEYSGSGVVQAHTSVTKNILKAPR